MTGTNCKNLWSGRLTSPSPALSTSGQSSLQITAPVHSPSVNSPTIYIPHHHTGIYLFCSFAPQYLPAHSSSACRSTIPVFNCYIVITSPPWPIYSLNLPHLLHSLYIDILFYFVLLYYWLCLFIPCVSYSVLFLSYCFALSWPGRICKWELVLNSPTWLNKGEIKQHCLQ